MAIERDEFESDRSNGVNGVATLPKMVRRVKRADEQLVSFVQERPVAALCAAIAVGYMVGRLFTRRG